MYGAFLMALPAWSGGTALGIVAGNLLPADVVSALSVALFGMFIAIIIPPAKKDRVILGLIIVSFLLSLLFRILPYVSTISSGTRTIILTLLIAGGAAILFPVKEEEKEEGPHGA
jgi:predicted branched-subunit amino acid permease